MEYTVRATITETHKYHIEASSPEEAKELVLSGECDPYETVNTSIDDVTVEKE